jgi:hypothetical protein
MFLYMLSLCRTSLAKMLGLILVILFIWLGCVALAVVLGVFPDGNGVLPTFH